MRAPFDRRAGVQERADRRLCARRVQPRIDDVQRRSSRRQRRDEAAQQVRRPRRRRLLHERLTEGDAEVAELEPRPRPAARSRVGDSTTSTCSAARRVSSAVSSCMPAPASCGAAVNATTTGSVARSCSSSSANVIAASTASWRSAS
ncbi:MAG: hypothetical protein H6835_01915 [Planctomycetes bacterium]|nr:hypothetical protein [Planctomycetota bacterium]